MKSYFYFFLSVFSLVFFQNCKKKEDKSEDLPLPTFPCQYKKIVTNGGTYYLFTYNNKGKIAERKAYRPNGKLYDRYEYTYDDKGNVKTFAAYDSTNTLSNKSDYQYTYEGEKQTSIIISTQVFNSGSSILVSTAKYYTYDSNGNLTSEKNVSPSNSDSTVYIQFTNNKPGWSLTYTKTSTANAYILSDSSKLTYDQNLTLAKKSKYLAGDTIPVSYFEYINTSDKSLTATRRYRRSYDFDCGTGSPFYMDYEESFTQTFDPTSGCVKTSVYSNKEFKLCGLEISREYGSTSTYEY